MQRWRLPLERRLGSVKLLALVASTGLAAQGLYREWAAVAGFERLCCVHCGVRCPSRPAEPAAGAAGQAALRARRGAC